MGIESIALQIVIGVALAALSYMITPRSKPDKPPAASQLEAPTAEAGITIPVVFGTITVKQLNVLWYGDIAVHEYDINT